MVKEGYRNTELGLIPKEWLVVHLNDILDLLTDFEANGSFADVKKNVTVYDSKNYAWYVRATDLEKKSSLCSVKYVDEKSYSFLKKTILLGDELLITKRGEIGKLYYFNKKQVKATLAPNLYLLKLNKEYVQTKYLFYYYSSYIGQKKLIRLNASSALGALYKDDVKKMKITLPTLKEQVKIASILTSVDNKIETVEHNIQKTKKLKNVLIQKLLSYGIGHSKFKDSELSVVYPMKKIPYQWQLKTLSDITTKITDGAHFTPTYVKSGIPFLRVTDLKSKNLLESKIKYIPKNEHIELLKRCNPENGDILYSKNGTIGLTRIVTWDWEFSIFVSLCLLKPNKDLIIPEYLSYYMISNIVNTQIKIRSKQGTVTNLHLEEIRDFFIAVPPLEEQKEIVNILSAVDKKEEILKNKKIKYKELKKGLMQKLLTGEIRVSI